jgi:putative ABC transport system substrate-binding protein
MFDLRRREFITLLGGAAATWPLVARAQQPTKMLRVGTVAGTPKSSPQWVAFERRMGELGYQEGKISPLIFCRLQARTSTNSYTGSSRRMRPMSFLLLARKSA